MSGADRWRDVCPVCGVHSGHGFGCPRGVTPLTPELERTLADRERAGELERRELGAGELHLGIVIPTLAVRGTMAHECAWAYHQNGYGAGELETLMIHEAPTCADAWNEGVRYFLSRGATHIHLTADDLRPRSPRVFDAALEMVDAGVIPCAAVYNLDTPDVLWNPQDRAAPFPRVPLLTAEMADRLFPMPSLHYYSDAWVGAVGAIEGWPAAFCEPFGFLHSWAQPGRIHDSEPDRLKYDYELATYKRKGSAE